MASLSSSSTLPAASGQGEPWFVLADVCRVLEIGNAPQAAGRLDADEKGIISVDTLGRKQNVIAINESGLYSLVLASRKEFCQDFSTRPRGRSF